MGEIKNDLLENRRFEKQNFSFSRIKRYFWIKRQEIFTTCLVETSSKVKMIGVVCKAKIDLMKKIE